MLLTAVVFFIILSALILIHELGHFLVARKLGIKVEEFGFGFPLTPAIFSFKRGETIYSFYPVLIGGFVKLYGEDDAGAGRITKIKDQSAKIKDHNYENRAFYSRSVGQRASVVVAGVVMNTILAIVIYYGFMFLANFKTELPVYPPGLSVPHFLLVNQTESSQVIIDAVAKNSPADKAGIKESSQILSVNGKKVEAADYFLLTVAANKGKQITLGWQDLKTNKKYTGVLTPRQNPPKNQGSLGVSFFPLETIILNYQTPKQKFLSGISHPVNLMYYQFVILGKLIGDSLHSGNVKVLSSAVSGPVGIYNLVGQVVAIPDLKERGLELLNLAGLLSISLALMNVLPIPGLDGGRLFLIIIEGIFGYKMKPKTEGLINQIGLAFLIILIIAITYKDVAQMFHK